MAVLRLVLGDQLSMELSSLTDATEADLIVMGELHTEASYVSHHPKKIALVFSAMRHFAKELKSKNFKVFYQVYNPGNSAQSFTELVKEALKKGSFETLCVTHPGEYRVLKELEKLQDSLNLNVEIREDTRFFCSLAEFKDYHSANKNLRLEHFYRHMRNQTQILMKDGKPVGGQWNFDSDNQKPPKDSLEPPKAYAPRADQITSDVLDLVEEHFSDHFGELRPFHLGVTRQEALEFLNRFIKERLVCFGDFQDAMMQDEPYMYHSLISFYLNLGLLSPKEVVEKAVDAFHSGAPINAVEGFVRQILGWREFVRGVYWSHMPSYADQNQLEHQNPLPELFWGAPTKLNCLATCVKEVKTSAYNHHIQRLMVLGNFLLLTRVDPKAVQDWYLSVYADAYEWVELPNVVGMILYADLGLFASKPYIASGNYINRMSNYCSNCSYRISKKNGPDACPFNYLYWDFLIHHKDTLKGNHRLARTYATLERFSKDKTKQIQTDAQAFRSELFKQA